ncbi:hypothetical protein MBGDF03_00977 [Thermoplasmatales archaeon SCGC AB-540-F20]|nr:hypothetical protein MBGDF03_00977 [Thermoplasmatales archaeon SCGC AB-540-F20]
MILKKNNEFVGELSDTQTQDGKHMLTFRISKKIEIPENAISIHKLKSLHGKRIGILHLGDSYILRILKE